MLNKALFECIRNIVPVYTTNAGGATGAELTGGLAGRATARAVDVVKYITEGAG